MWYGLMYAISFVGFHIWVQWKSSHGGYLSKDDSYAFMLYLILGVLLGGRIGWTLFYGEGILWRDPLQVLKIWQGGMSFHGGLLGVITALLLFVWRKKLDFVSVGDFFIPWLPVGLFLGRIGNFINGELYGIPTNREWGVIFKSDSLQLPRHPTQLYESLLEGVFLFLLLFLLARKNPPRGVVSASFFAGYGAVRIGIEFIRIPDPQLGYLWGPLTMGMLLSIPMLLLGVTWLLWILRLRLKSKG